MPALRDFITCIHCWTKFDVEKVHWRSEHRELLGDPLLGKNEQLRFLPNRFNLDGNAIDVGGEVCRELACPSCHLTLPRSVLEREPIFVSILGTPSCGKSFYLGALVNQLRRDLPARFALSFRDASPEGNQIISSYENNLFLNRDRLLDVPLADLILRTQLHGQLYHSVRRGEQSVSYPKPFTYLVEPDRGHPNYGKSEALQRIVCLYDNAGEHFLPGRDSLNAPGTRHLAESSFLLFLYDPTQDPRWHAAMERSGIEINLPITAHAGRQEAVLDEAGTRIRRLLGLADSERINRPLIMVVCKADLWESILPSFKGISPVVKISDGCQAINESYVRQVSDDLRNVLLRIIPEATHSAEALSNEVYYLPVSALGKVPHLSNGVACIRPAEIKPRGVVMPFVLGLAQVANGLVAKAQPIAPHFAGQRPHVADIA